MALSAQLVEGMGGEIEAGNRDEGGAVFTVRLPEAGMSEEGRDPFLDPLEQNPGEEAQRGDQR